MEWSHAATAGGTVCNSRLTWALMIFVSAAFAVWGVSMYYRSYWAQLAGHRVMLDLRTDLFQHVQRLSHSFYQARQSGGIVSRLTAERDGLPRPAGSPEPGRRGSMGRAAPTLQAR